MMMSRNSIIDVLTHADLSDEDFKSGDIWVDADLSNNPDPTAKHRINLWFDLDGWTATVYNDYLEEDTGNWSTDTTSSIVNFQLGRKQEWMRGY